MKPSKLLNGILALTMVLTGPMISESVAQQVCNPQTGVCYDLSTGVSTQSYKTKQVPAGLFGQRTRTVRVPATRTTQAAYAPTPRYSGMSYSPQSYGSNGGYNASQASHGGYNRSMVAAPQIQIVSERVVSTTNPNAAACCGGTCDCPECGHSFRCNCSTQVGKKPAAKTQAASDSTTTTLKYILKSLEEDPDWEPQANASDNLKELAKSLRAWKDREVENALANVAEPARSKTKTSDSPTEAQVAASDSSKAVVPSLASAKPRAAVPSHIVRGNHGDALRDTGKRLAAHVPLIF